MQAFLFLLKHLFPCSPWHSGLGPVWSSRHWPQYYKRKLPSHHFKGFLFFFQVFFFMWTIFLKVFIEFFAILFLFYSLAFWPWGHVDLRSLTRGWTCTFCIGRWSQPLDHQLPWGFLSLWLAWLQNLWKLLCSSVSFKQVDRLHSLVAALQRSLTFLPSHRSQMGGREGFRKNNAASVLTSSLRWAVADSKNRQAISSWEIGLGFLWKISVELVPRLDQCKYSAGSVA